MSCIGSQKAARGAPPCRCRVLPYDDTNVTGGTKYFYIVRAIDDGTAGAWSNTVSATVPGGTSAPTGKPTMSASADGLNGVDLSWTAVSDATSYDLRRWNSDTSSWDSIGNNPTGTSHDDDSLTPGEQYWYVIRAVNDGGNGPWSSEGGVGYTTVTLVSATIVPVLSFTHTSRETVVLTWTAVTEAGAQYELQRMTAVTGTDVGNASFGRLPDNALSGTTYTDNEAVFVPNSTTTTYTYRVQAVIDGEQGDYSNTVSVQIPASGVRPPAPSINKPSATSSTTIVVSWSQVPVATSYELQYKTGDGAYSSPITIRITPSNADSPSYTHRGRSAGTKYTYQVRSKNINGDSDWSAAESLVTPAAPSTGGQRLATPRSLNAANDSDVDTPNLKVSWGSVTGANGYELKQWLPNPSDENPTTSWTVVNFGEDADVIAEIVKNRSYTLAELTPAATYYFVVRAIEFQVTAIDDPSLSDTEDDTSEWSAPFSGTTRSHKPSVPTGLTVKPRSDSTIWLSWTQTGVSDEEPLPTGTGLPTSYTIEWRRGSSRGTINVEGRTTSLHMNLSSNMTYYYRVRANNAGGSSEWYPNPNYGTGESQAACTADANAEGCSEIEIKGTTSARALMPPANISAEAVAPQSITLKWDAVTGAIGYEIQRWDTSTTPDSWMRLDADGVTDIADTDDAFELVPEGTTTFTHTGIGTAPDPGEHHTEYYVIRTVSQGGVSSTWSDLVVGRTQPAPVTVDDRPTLTVVPTGETMVRLTWSPITGATGYLVEYTEGATTPEEFAEERIPRQSFSALVNPTYRTHTGLKVGTRYSYRITAVLASEAMSAPSAPVQVITKPATPVLRGSATTTTSVELTFPQVVLDGDHLGVIGDYEVQRRVTGGLWSGIDETLTLVANTCIGVGEDENEVACKFTDRTGLEMGTTYFYRIRVAKTGLTGIATGPGSSDEDGPLTSYWRQIRVRTPSN